MVYRVEDSGFFGRGGIYKGSSAFQEESRRVFQKLHTGSRRRPKLMRIELLSAVIYMVYLQQHNQRTTPVNNVAGCGQERDQLVSEARKMPTR